MREKIAETHVYLAKRELKETCMVCKESIFYMFRLAPKSTPPKDAYKYVQEINCMARCKWFSQ